MIPHKANVLYREVQRFRQKWLWILLLGMGGLAVYALVEQMILGRPFGTNPAPDIVVVILVVVFGLGLPTLFYWGNLTTEVRIDGLYFRFFPFHLSFQRIPLEELTGYEVQTYSPIKDYGGWGIRCGVKGKAYNVSGNRGVQLRLSNGRRILIGSDRPEEFARAIDLVFKKPSLVELEADS